MEVANSKEITSEDLALFKDALLEPGYDNIEVKLFTIKRISSLAKGLGPERTREELICLLSDQIDNLEDEVLYTLVEELEFFLPLVGGPEYCYEVLSMLLKISRSVDEPLVRNKAIDAIKVLLAEIDQQLTEKYLVSSIVQLDDNVWFSEKCSTLSLIPICYSKASPANKILLRNKYCQIFSDNSTLIRKLAAVGLADFINVLEIEHVLKEFIPMLNQIVEDDQEAVKINAAEVALAVANKSKNQDVRNDMLEIIKKLSNNSSWRIRQRIAVLFDTVSESFKNMEFVSSLLEMYENLINDDESEVRVGAVQNMFNLAKNLFDCFEKNNSSNKFNDFFLQSYMPIILSINSDCSNEVQIAFASRILSLSSIIPSEIFKKTILPIVISGLEQDKPLLFKENLLMNLDSLPKDIDLIESLNSINGLIQNILVTSETSWRTRRSLLITLVHISKCCSEEFFKKNLLVYYVVLLKDNVYAVRRTATMILPLLVKRFGIKWLINEIMPQIHAFIKIEKYLLRYVILFAIQELIYPSAEVGVSVNADGKYLGDIKKLIQCSSGNKHIKILCRITRLNTRLRSTLNDEPFSSILETYVDINNIEGEDVKIYSEQIMETITNTKIHLFCMQNNKEDEMCYLEGILILLNKEILNLLKILLEDPTNNIQDRTKYVITKIHKFSEELNTEIQASWVLGYTLGIQEVTWKEIDEQITQLVKEAQISCEYYEKIDTELMESMSTGPSVHHKAENLDPEKLEVFPSDSLSSEEVHIDQLECVDEEKVKDSSIAEKKLT